jgi:hypothetical protein
LHFRLTEFYEIRLWELRNGGQTAFPLSRPSIGFEQSG